MKNLLFIFLALVLLSSTCDPYDDEYYSDYKPILMSRADMEASIGFEKARTLISPGKMYFKDNYIFINEKYKGVHIINNEDPANPINIGFISVPGCIDMAVKYNSLYVDNAVDLVTINLENDFENIEVTDRIKYVFPELRPPDGKPINPQFYDENRPLGTIIVGWEQKY